MNQGSSDTQLQTPGAWRGGMIWARIYSLIRTFALRLESKRALLTMPYYGAILFPKPIGSLYIGERDLFSAHDCKVDSI